MTRMARDYDEDDRLSEEKRPLSRRRARRDDEDEDRLSEERSSRRRSRDEEEDDLPKRGKSKLGNLSQDARLKEIKTAGIVLIVAGILSAGNGIYLAATAAEQMRAAGYSQQQMAAELPGAYLVGGAITVLGVIFVILGACIKSAPLPISVSALVLFLGLHAFLALINPANLIMGLILKIIVLVALFKAIQAALAYSKTVNRTAEEY
jgi:hypothetical protein